MAKLGILVDERGVTSVSLIAADSVDRRRAMGFYTLIRPAVEHFERLVRAHLAQYQPKRIERGSEPVVAGEPDDAP